MSKGNGQALIIAMIFSVLCPPLGFIILLAVAVDAGGPNKK